MTSVVHPRSRVREPWGYTVLGLSNGAVAVSNNNTDDATPKVLGTFTIPGGTMLENSLIRVWSWWTYTNSANGKVLAPRYNGSSMGQTTVTTTSNIACLNMIYNNNSLSQQRGPNSIAISGSANSNAPISVTADTRLDVPITFTCNWSANVSPAASETITLEKWLIELFV